MKINNSAFLICLLIATSVGAFAQVPTIKVTIRVVDEQNNPIPKADVRTGYYQLSGGHRVIEGESGANGVFIFSGNPAEHSIQALVSKNGYYQSEKRFSIAESVDGYAVNTDTEVKFVLREMRDPVPMYAGRIKIPFPDPKGGRFGFDLLKRDWVAPYGSGSQVDIWITLNFEYRDRNDFEINVTWDFEGEGNGIQSFEPSIPYSMYKSPYQAPAVGYESNISWTWYRRPDPQSGQGFGKSTILSHRDFEFSSALAYPQNFYLIRIRSTKNDDGEVEGGHFGKIYSTGSLALAVEGNENAEIFTGVIYLNPIKDDHNIECDLEWNRLEGLPRDLRPRFP